jgi:hypothetical protein
MRFANVTGTRSLRCETEARHTLASVRVAPSVAVFLVGRHFAMLMRYHDQKRQDWADIIDMLTMHPEARRKIVRLLGETQAESR